MLFFVELSLFLPQPPRDKDVIPLIRVSIGSKQMANFYDRISD